jgi:hypothetical protein
MAKMKTKVSRLVVCVAVVALVLSTFALPVMAAEKAKKPAAETMTITGSVVELMKAEKGKPAVIGIKTDKADYMLSGKKTAELTKLVGKKVEATGAVHEKTGKQYINVKSYKVME